jgi:hypothetical protein
MKEIKKVLCLVVLALMLISAASAIAEHSKAETVERMKMPELQSADNGNASAIEAHQLSKLPGEATPSTRTPMGQLEPTDQYTGAQSPPDGLYMLEIHNGQITKIEYQSVTNSTITDLYSQQYLTQGRETLPGLAKTLGSLWGCDVGCWKSGYRGQAYEDCCEKCWAAEGYVV